MNQSTVVDCGCMTSELFIDVLQHFIKYSNTTLNKSSILICDNHESHVSLEIAKAAGVIILTLPPHTSNKLQPMTKQCFAHSRLSITVLLMCGL